jgi:hypothetical protein
MPGFFAHTGNSHGSYTALPVVPGSGILDSIVTDIAGGVNGWTVYDDQRTAGTGTTMVVNAFNQGMFRNSVTTVSAAWTVVSGSGIMIGSTSQGYNAAYGFGGTSTDPVDISFDGTNWYTCYYSAWPNDKVTGTLDRNYAQASAFTNKLKLRCRSYIVLECSSSQKTFYVQIGLKKGNIGGPMLFTRAYESWSLSSHTGTMPGQMEVFFPYVAPVADASKVQYVLCLYPNAIFLWMDGVNTQNGQYQLCASCMYIGNLDTSQFRAAPDPNALWAGWSNTSYSGIQISKTDAFNLGWQFWGNGMCLRTRGGSPWLPVTDYHVPTPNTHISPYVYYQFVPRGRTYLEFMTGGTINSAGKTLLCSADIYQGSAQSAYVTQYYTNNEGPPTYEGVRGELRYLKIPVTSPVGQHLRTWGPMQDGRTYIILRTAAVHWMGNGATQQGGGDAAASLAIPSSFARVIPPSSTAAGRPIGDAWSGTINGNTASQWRFFAMPVL